MFSGLKGNALFPVTAENLGGSLGRFVSKLSKGGKTVIKLRV
jgi:hypothetical protein